ncbi:tetratricopeptide (TPR) repeat protein [Methanolinea mesophila]|uniref:tetratricopeptide repeat protein n=1 Tax=Methanolinea mesophila TaxID=547055 RepID=UPI001AE3A6E8|nr:bacterial transcriptional activator domain-containing protein [Methanolinea mesophila]MBP1928328.1 tetratricopeptide (TPR) repeat protein [Methanolinea mesophila]
MHIRLIPLLAALLLLATGIGSVAAADGEPLVMVMNGTGAYPLLTADNYYQMGLADAKVARHAQAIQEFQQAVALDPTFARAYFALGQSYAALGDHMNAIEAYRQAIALSPGLAPMVQSYLASSEAIVYPAIPSGTILSGSTQPGWQYLTVDNTQGMWDVVVAVSQPGLKTASAAVYVQQGDFQTFYQLIPPGTYNFYISVGKRWNAVTNSFEVNPSYLKWTVPQYLEGSNGYGYTMTFISNKPYPNWFAPQLQYITPQQFPKI